MNVIVDADIEWLLQVPKEVADANWRAHLLPPRPVGFDCRGRYDLGDLPDGGPLGGSLHLYARQNLDPRVHGDWSVGLVYSDYAENRYPVVRCNGPHPTDHPNRIEGNVIVRTPHVHRLTERYQRRRPPKPDGFAEATHAYSDIASAVEYLATLVNLQPVGRLLL